ncbi:unnamed protein product, partial [Laminaria digitata]
GSNPYEDFDAIHDQDNFKGTNVELDCRTPRDVLNFCRPRSGTNYESAKGAGPGFFESEDDGVVAGNGNGEHSSAEDEQSTGSSWYG